MELTDLRKKSILILGFGVEGVSTYKFLRELLPKHRIGIADARAIDKLSQEAQDLLITGTPVILSWNFGKDYLSFCDRYDVIVKSPGLQPNLPEIEAAVRRGAVLTSHTEIFFRNCPNQTIGVTGTKGKGTTSKLIYTILHEAGIDVYLVGNIGNPPLDYLNGANTDSVFVFELSSQQLQGLTISPHIAVCLRIVPDHLDHHGSFDEYVSSKQNIILHQTKDDYFVFNPENEIALEFSKNTAARIATFALSKTIHAQCYIENNQIYFSDEAKNIKEPIVSTQEALQYVPGMFNLNNILPAIIVVKLLGVDTSHIIKAIKKFKPLPNRFEKVGTLRGVIFYNASISTVPAVTIEHIVSLGTDVQTLLLGGFDRGIDFTELGEAIRRNKIKNLILFPTTGERIWEAVCKAFERVGENNFPHKFVITSKTGIDAMKEAVTIAIENTEQGKICLHSPASPSFGLFQDYKERGDLFKKFVTELNYTEK